jgi:iron complex outermembrane receptor protein
MRAGCERRFVSKQRWTGGLETAILLWAGSCGLAQAAEADNAADQLQEVIVTAQRHEENLQKASLTIQVIGDDQVQKAGLSDVTDLTRVTTGVEIGVGGVNDQIFIRGVGSFAESPLSSPGVAFNVDGVYVGRPDGIGANFYDVARVEVLKGPQGTLYGRNANGGSINVITNEPVLGKDSAGLSEEVGNYGLTRTQGFGNLAIGETSALRAAFDIVHRQGYLSDHTDDDVHQSGRLRYKLAPNEDLTVHLNVDYTHLGGRGDGAVWLPLRPGADPWESTTAPAANDYLHSIPPLGPLVDSQLPDSFQNSHFLNVSGQLDWNVGIGTLTVLPAYRKSDIEALTYQGLRYTQLEGTKQESVEARLGNTTERITWVVGAYYFDESPTGSTGVYQSNLLQNYLIRYHPTTKAPAGFGQVTYSIVPGFRIIAGGRYTHEHATLTGALNNEATTPSTVIEAFGGAKTFTGWTYKAGLDWDVAADNMLYATYSTGFKSGGFSQTVAPANIFQPEKLRSAEIGSHNRFLDNRVQVNFSLYHWKYTDLQDQRVNFDPLGNVNFITYNAGDATIEGATLDVMTRPTREDMLSLGIEYANSHYDSYWFQTPAVVFEPTSTGCRVSGPYAPGAALPYTDSSGNGTNVGPLPVVVGSCAGFQVARVPLWTGTMSYAHELALPGGAKLRLGADMKFATARWLNIDFVAAERDGTYRTFDSNLDYLSTSGKWQVGLFGRNLGNEAYYTGGLQQSFVGGLFAANIAPPRTYGAQASIRFGN